ncbi:hypothetical protein FisN_10Hh399 [Fistulifera solaris]|uniref:VWFA domain-containing protein n=1 Tax=Fistulifera solaris TaxID=1519565 RepID=A0A1Z5JQU3_FISSO|nr:hypothetical protein FisN_10Hh399 [Fistulifera solaris]|eukprot:GAX16383.1 hypothetical protein FisN_10Hh399 [Fistulifera solaris]
MMRRLIFLLFFLIRSVFGLNTARFDQVTAKMESMVLAYRDEIERLYLDRCVSLTTCGAANYDECKSALPNLTCSAPSKFWTDTCGAGCAGLEDLTTSNYRISPNATPADPLIVEAICYSRFMDDWLTQRIQEDQAFWDEIGISPRASYFGTREGAFRILPGFPSEGCGTYDNTGRPWYVAGSSGPKNIVLVLDISSSMNEIRLGLMKQAAKRVIDTLSTSDRVAIVFFNAATTVVANQGLLYAATDEIKKILKDSIDNIGTGRGTNMLDGLSTAFDILDNSFTNGTAVSCNSGILFFTDGVMTEPDGIVPADVKTMVQNRISQTTAVTGKPVLLFTYSIADESENQNVHAFPSELACLTEFGIWSKIESDEEIVEALASYYLLFALGLGNAENQYFTAWVEPYIFRTANILGTTVSAPVYDRTKSPPLFIGVAAIDIALEALRIALEDEDVDEAIRLLALRSVGTCPAFRISSCELDSYRYASGGFGARCTDCSIDDLGQTIATQCSDSSLYPTNLNANTDTEGRPFQERVCCGCVTGAPFLSPVAPEMTTTPPTVAPVMASPSPVALKPVVGSTPTVAPVKPTAPTAAPVNISAPTVATVPSPPVAPPTSREDIVIAVIGALGTVIGAAVTGGIAVTCYRHYHPPQPQPQLQPQPQPPNNPQQPQPLNPNPNPNPQPPNPQQPQPLNPNPNPNPQPPNPQQPQPLNPNPQQP